MRSRRSAAPVTFLTVLAALSLLALPACRSRDNCYKTYPNEISPTDEALGKDGDEPKVEHGPTAPVANTLPPPPGPTNTPR
jgi:hypothetical protein